MLIMVNPHSTINRNKTKKENTKLVVFCFLHVLDDGICLEFLGLWELSTPSLSSFSIMENTRSNQLRMYLYTGHCATEAKERRENPWHILYNLECNFIKGRHITCNMYRPLCTFMQFHVYGIQITWVWLWLRVDRLIQINIKLTTVRLGKVAR